MNLEALEERARGGAIGAVRILVGLLWLANVHWKVPGRFGEDTGGGLYKYVAAGADNAPLAPFRWLLREVVLPNYVAFGWFTLLSEVLVAGWLIIGWKARWAALVGLGLSVPIMLTVLYYPRADEWSWSYLLMIGAHLLLWAIAAGDHVGVDGLLGGSPDRHRQGLTTLGLVTVAMGLVGLWVARDVDFAGRAAALLGSDAGFMRDGQLVRRWELKFVWFNPMWALLTTVAGALLLASRKVASLALAAAALLAGMAIAVMAQLRFDYQRDDGAVQQVATGSNAALWGAFAVAAVVIYLHARRRTPEAATATE